MARRTRKRYGNDGGGFPLGQILALAMGGGEANPDFEAAQAAQAGGQQGPLTAGQETALKTGPNRPSNIFQKFYGMDYGDQANEDYRLGKIQAEEALQRQLGAIPKVEAAQTDAKISSTKKLLDAKAEQWAPSIQAMMLSGELTPIGIDLRHMSPKEIAAEYIRRFDEGGLYPTLSKGEAERVKLKGETAKLPRAGEEARTAQSARIAKSGADEGLDTARKDVLDQYPDDVRTGIRGEAVAPAGRSIGGVYFPNIFDLSNSISATPEVRGDNMLGVPAQPAAPVFFTPHGVGGPGVTGRFGSPAPAPTPTKPAPSASKPMSATQPARVAPAAGGPLQPSYSSVANAPPASATQAIVPAQKTPEQILEEQLEAAKRLRMIFDPLTRGY